jgi:hypothetical protein
MFEEDKDGRDGGLLMVGGAGMWNKAGQSGARWTRPGLGPASEGQASVCFPTPTRTWRKASQPSPSPASRPDSCLRPTSTLPDPGENNNGRLPTQGRPHRSHHTGSCSFIFFRLGQEPPPQPTEDSFDGRSLAEVSLSKLCGPPLC